MFETIKELIETAEKKKIALHELILEDEAKTNEWTKERVIEKLRRSFDVMKQSLKKGTTTEVVLPIKEAMEQSEKMRKEPIFFSKNIKEAVYWSMSIAEFNSGMGLICAAPTAGSAGVLPATLFKAQQMLGKSDEETLNALIVGSEVGAIIGNNATLSGSEGGCQAEVGVASAMAAAAITYLAGGNGDQVVNAVALALINLMGLICDPVAGLVIIPCINRNAIGVLNAFLAAESALSGVTSVIPVDEVVTAMMNVGKKLPYELKETGLGGLAATPTAKKIKEQIFGK